MTVYRIFDISIACSFPIKGLLVIESECPDWQIYLEDDQHSEIELTWFYSWKAPNGEEVMACARQGEEYFLKFNGVACFVIDFKSQTISAVPIDNCSENTLAHLLIDQVIPRILGHQGRMVVHASAVEIAAGHAVAFTGASGQGKSTLASAFFSDGYRLLTDDCLLLENRGGSVYAMASYPSLRLWDDSAKAIVEEGGAREVCFSRTAHYTNKKQLLLGDGDASIAPAWVRLDRLYLLEFSPVQTGSHHVQIIPAGGVVSIMTLIESLFALDGVGEKSVRRNFELVQQVAGDVKIKRLMYSRGYEYLPEVTEAVCRDLY